ncbi:MAG: flagellar basal body L-ring protein FlgH [Bdellovibrionaceae bacterium]|nr:flagellar basal body L-ring protein FlgH [Pseudobdellovibrionaceae bacterium]
MRIVVLVIFSLSFMGCANFGKKMKSFLRGESATASEENLQQTKYDKKFSQNANYIKGPQRKYKHTKRSTLENESLLADNSGSLWVMEGQGAYLFSQNIMRMIGDPLAVRIDGEPREQLESKVKIIVDLLNSLSLKRQQAARRIAAQQEAKSKKEGAKNVTAKDGSTQGSTADNSKNKDENKPEYDSIFPVKTVPTRIIERSVDGNYRVKGSQPFMIGKREYNVIVTGIVRAEDFTEEGMSSSKLLDPKFDIVSKKRRDTN